MDGKTCGSIGLSGYKYVSSSSSSSSFSSSSGSAMMSSLFFRSNAVAAFPRILLFPRCCDDLLFITPRFTNASLAASKRMRPFLNQTTYKQNNGKWVNATRTVKVKPEKNVMMM